MQRGILELTKEELNTLSLNFNLENCQNSLICNKIKDSLSQIQDNNRIFVSEEELETILDEVGFVGDTEDVALKNTMTKISTLLYQFRQQGHPD